MTFLNSLSPQFIKIKQSIWPIHRTESKKFLSLSLMMFFILFNYTLLRNTKDALIVTAPACGAEAIPFLKIWCVLPCAVLFFFVYTKLSNILSQQNIFYVCFIPFLVFFALFAFLIFPNQRFLHPCPQLIMELQSSYPQFKWFFSIYGSWSYSLFYILGELWGTIVLSLLFWQFANEITLTNEAKRFYSFFGLIGNIALIGAGKLGEWISEIMKNKALNFEDSEINVFYIIIIVLIIGIFILAIYWWITKYILRNPLYYIGDINKKKKKEDLKLSMKESLIYLFSSKYLGFISILVISYGISSNLIDVTWKSQVKIYFPQTTDYLAFMSNFSFWTGIITIIFIFLTKGVVTQFGWLIGAIITPLVLLITGSIFFAFILFKEDSFFIASFFGFIPLYMTIMVGALQNILSKGMKYSLFDPTKEMTYIPLDQELKTKGKAAVDVLGGRIGKSGGGFLQFLLLTFTMGTQLTIVPYLLTTILIIGLSWIWAIGKLSKLYNKKIKENENV